MTKLEEEFKGICEKVKDKFPDTEFYALPRVEDVIEYFKNWHSDEEFQEMKESYWNQAESILSMLDEIKSLKSQLQQQALPVVPECVAKFVSGDENELSKADRIAYLLKSVQGDSYYLTEELPGDGTITVDEGQELYNWAICQHHETILKLWNGYTVEKQQQKRYEVKLLSGESMYFNPIGNSKNIKDYRFSFGNYAGWKTQFTKSELSEIKNGMFLKRIPGGTPLDDLGKDKSYYVWIEDCNYWKNPFIELVPVEDGE